MVTPIATTSRRNFLAGVFATTVVSAAPVYAKAAGFLRNAGDVRRISMRSQRSGEMIDTIYWIEGQYIKPALEEINLLMRDWRQNEAIQIDRRNIDIMAAAHSLLETTEPYLLLSGYRSPKTNAMLRSRSKA
ncbi:MAG TPA: DUF882 domain-containing protein, partial [Paracoccaceae bacterium]|nr:DUF882 domain-containing protein [Paracoccaceae bacterium]